jgi:hypothetical protein
VVNVRVRQHQRLHLAGLIEEVPVAIPGLAAPALVQPAVQQNFMAVDGQQMLRTGNRLRRAVKGDFHRGDSTMLFASQVTTSFKRAVFG